MENKQTNWLTEEQSVLILIIMEDTHGVSHSYAVYTRKSLNPYYNGRYSWSPEKHLVFCKNTASLNPYYNGRYSWSQSRFKS